jgi:hypothetical protein
VIRPRTSERFVDKLSLADSPPLSTLPMSSDRKAKGRLRTHLLSRALQAWLDHRNIQHTVRYTELAPDR